LTFPSIAHCWFIDEDEEDDYKNSKVSFIPNLCIIFANEWNNKKLLYIPGIGDVKPNHRLLSAKQKLLDKGYKICGQLNKAMRLEREKAMPDNGLLEELEAKILKELSNIRDQAGKACRDFLRCGIY
jgi:hypothetical protein